MSYKIFYHQDIQKDLSDLPQNIKERICKAIEDRLLKDPIKYSDALRKSLKGYRKLRIGDYRVIFKMEEEDIIVLKIGHRKEIYNKQNRSSADIL